MSTMHPHNYQHDHSREADDLFDEFTAIFRRARRGASDTLRAHRDRQSRLDRAARDARMAARDAERAAARGDRSGGDASTSGSGKTRVRVSDNAPGDASVSEDLIARWAAAHAVADLFREEATAAEARAAESKDSSAAAQAAKAHTDAETAATWAQAWDERVRDAGVDPDDLAADRDTDRDIADPHRTPTQRIPDAETEPHTEAEAEPAVFAADTGTDAEDFINRIATRAGEMAIDTADDLDAGTNTVASVGELIAATRTDGAAAEAGTESSPSLAALPPQGLEPGMVDLDAGAAL